MQFETEREFDLALGASEPSYGDATDAADELVWQRLANGEFDPSSEAALADLLQCPGDASRVTALFAPLRDDFADSMADRIFETASAAGSTEPATELPSAEVIELRPRRRWGTATAAALLAACLALFLLGPGEMSQPVSSAHALPSYSLEFGGGDVANRSSTLEAVATLGIRRQTEIKISLKPPAVHSRKIEVRGFQASGDEVLALGTPRFHQGTFFYSGPAARILPSATPGQHTLVFLVSHRGAMPESPEAIASAFVRGESVAPDGVQVLGRRIVID